VRTPGLAERLGRHLAECGRLEEALAPLQEAATERRVHSDYDDALRLLDQRDAVLSRLDLDTSDPRWGEGWALRADLLIGLGRLPEAEAMALRIVHQGTTHGWRELVPRAFRHAGAVAAKRGHLDLAEERLMEGRRIARENADEEENSRILLLLGDIARLRGDPELALRRCRKALGQFAVIGDPRGQADVLVALSAACRVMGDLQRTESYARQAIPLFERVGSRFGVASCENALGEVLRARGDLAGAETAYRHAEVLLRNLGSPEHRVPQLNLGLVLLARGHFDKAREVLGEVLDAFHRGGRRSLEGALHVFLLSCAAQALDWKGWKRHLEGARTLLEESGFVDSDIAWAAELGAEQAEAMGGREEALAALQLAKAQWKALGNTRKVRELEEKFTHLG
jgi:tetratricopeptide (TPR) repeat protein